MKQTEALHLYLPAAAGDALRSRAFRAGMTLNNYVLRILRDAGALTPSPDDITDWAVEGRPRDRRRGR